MEVSGRRQAGCQEVVNVCDNCMRKSSISRPAFGYCTDCYEYLCADCYKCHRDPKPSRDHQMLEGAKMPRERPQPVDICQTHPKETIQYYCKGHSELACQKCAFLKHRMCKNVDEISKVSGDSKTDQGYTEITQKIAALGSKLDKTRKTRLQNISTIDSHKKQANTDIKNFCKEIHDYLTKLEHEVYREVDQIGDEDKKNMDKLLQECDWVSADLNVVSSELETNQGSNRRDQLFIALVKARAKIGTLDNKVTSLSNDNTIHEYTFVPDVRLKGVMADVNILGKLAFRDTAKSVSSHPSQHKVKVKPLWDMDSVVAETKDGINVQTQSDTKTCRITGVTLLEEDKTLAVTDCDNRSVKLVDMTQNKVVSKIRLPSYPWDITKVQPNQLAVTLPASHKIQFLSVTGTSLSLGRQMKVSGYCEGIASNQHDRLFVSFFDPLGMNTGKVQILDMSGSVLNTISNQTVGEELFVYPYYLTLSVDNSLLYVTDSSTSSVCCLDMSGKVKGKLYKLEGAIRGVTVAEDGAVIVCTCAWSSNKLHIMSSDCSRAKVLVDNTRGLVSPNCVMYSSAQSILYVGEGSDTLKKFRLK